MGIYSKPRVCHLLQDDERASKRRREADRRMRWPKWATLGIGQCWKFVCQIPTKLLLSTGFIVKSTAMSNAHDGWGFNYAICQYIPTIISFGGSMSFKNHIQECGWHLWQTCILSIYFNEAFWSWISLQIFVKCFFFPLYPCWLIYRLFGAIFFWNPRRGEMASLASFMRFDRFFRCDTTKPPAGKNVSFLKISPKVFVLHFCVKKDFWIRYFFPQKIWFEKLKNKIWMGKIVRAKIVSSVQEGEIHHDPC